MVKVVLSHSQVSHSIKRSKVPFFVSLQVQPRFEGKREGSGTVLSGVTLQLPYCGLKGRLDGSNMLPTRIVLTPNYPIPSSVPIINHAITITITPHDACCPCLKCVHFSFESF